ncbi:MAG: hypothetical protein ABI707_02435 [Ferruginibacter sp.]
MKNSLFSLLTIFAVSFLFASCSNPVKQELAKPQLRIKIRDDSGKIISGASVRLYKNISDLGFTQISDSTGLVIFSELELVLYYWLAEKGCETNRISQMTLNQALIPGAVHYGYSVLAETGALKIINNSPQAYKVSDSLINITISKDTPYIAYRRVRSYLIHSENSSTPGVGKDTLIRIRCGDTTIITLPY